MATIQEQINAIKNETRLESIIPAQVGEVLEDMHEATVEKPSVFTSTTDPALNPNNNVKDGDCWVRNSVTYERVNGVWKTYLPVTLNDNGEVGVSVGTLKLFAGVLTKLFIGDEIIEIVANEEGVSYIQLGDAKLENDGSVSGKKIKLYDADGLQYIVDINNDLLAIKDNMGIPLAFLNKGGDLTLGLGEGKINNVDLANKQDKISAIAASQNEEGETILTLTVS